MSESFTDPATGWIVTRETVVRSGVELVWEFLTDPATGEVHDGGLRSPDIPRDIGAWAGSYTVQPRHMDYHLVFWKQTPGVSADPREVYQRLIHGKRVPGLDELPGARVKARVLDAFASGWYQRNELYWEGPGVRVAVRIGPQHFGIECNVLPVELLNRFMEIGAEFGCNPFDPQAGEPSEVKKLQGLWQRSLGGVVHRDGKQVVVGPFPDGPCFFIHGDRLIWLDKEGKPSGPEFAIKLEVTADPKRITLTPVGDGLVMKPSHGIYSVTGESLRLHFGLDGGPAPKQFLEPNSPIKGVDGVEWLVARKKLQGIEPPSRTSR